MLLLVGLGNPGPKYANHRHNIGYRVVDEIVHHHGFGPWRSKFQALVSEGQLAGEKVLAVKPTTYMNESGRALAEILRFYKLDLDDVVVFHDELDLPPGKVRIKTGGGHGGNNGVRSATSHIGADFRRVRIGIGHPGRKDLVARYVLHDFARADTTWIEPLVDVLAIHADLLAAGKDSSYANKIHLATQPEKPERKPKSKTKDPKPDSKPPSEAVSEPEPEQKKGPMAAALARLLGAKKDT